jgi:hypothetical protein
MDVIFAVGIGLTVLGVILFFLGRNSVRQDVKKVGRDDRSVSVGGDNSGLINTGSIGGGASTSDEKAGHSHFLTWVAILVEVVGIGVTLWHAYHVMHQ